MSSQESRDSQTSTVENSMEKDFNNFISFDSCGGLCRSGIVRDFFLYD